MAIAGKTTETNKPLLDRPPSKRGRVGIVAVYAVFLVVLVTGLECAARILVDRTRDPNLGMTVRSCELLVRGDEHQFRFVPDKVLPYKLRPGFEFESSDGLQHTKHNASGFRANSEFDPKKGGKTRIICLGGSTTYGASVVDNDSTYPSQLEKLLNSDVRVERWEDVEVLNLGVGGYTSHEDLLNLRIYGMPLDPDVVVIQSGVNDVAPRFYPELHAEYAHFRKPLTAVEAGALTKGIYRSKLLILLGWQFGLIQPLTLQSRTQYPLPPGEEAVENMARNGVGEYTRNLSEMLDILEASNVEVWLLTGAHLFGVHFLAPDEEGRLLDDAYRRGLIEHNEVVRSIAAERGVGVVDLERRMPMRREFFSDPIHMTEEGNLVKARIIAEAMQSASRNTEMGTYVGQNR